MDLIIDHMGLDTDVDRARVASHLAPLLDELDRIAGKWPDPVRHAAMADRVIAALRNDDDRRRPFEARYVDIDDGRLVHRVREFRLVYDQFHPEGGTVLRLSNEAVNLFLGARTCSRSATRPSWSACCSIRGATSPAWTGGWRCRACSTRRSPTCRRACWSSRRSST